MCLCVFERETKTEIQRKYAYKESEGEREQLKKQHNKLENGTREKRCNYILILENKNVSESAQITRKTHHLLLVSVAVRVQ